MRKVCGVARPRLDHLLIPNGLPLWPRSQGAGREINLVHVVDLKPLRVAHP